ncbi:hypothetical protein J5X84_22755 [Streptosporangiaceae bacterium NEAU-GS5]|nr:hypothetical protein [Streptosporangiaceae bacterium NEAU-GS5]
MTEDLLDTSPFGDDLEAELTAQPSRDGPSRVTLALAGGVLLVAGLLGGVQAQKAWGTSGTSGGNARAAGTGLPGGFGGGGFGGFGGAGNRQRGQGQGQGQGQQNPSQGQQPGQQQGQGGFGGVTVGTVKLIDGKKIYVETAQGSVVTVTTSGDTKISVTKAGKLSDLKAGNTVVVRGEQGGDGTLAATNVTSGQLGATP